MYRLTYLGQVDLSVRASTLSRTFTISKLWKPSEPKSLSTHPTTLTPFIEHEPDITDQWRRRVAPHPPCISSSSLDVLSVGKAM